MRAISVAAVFALLWAPLALPALEALQDSSQTLVSPGAALTLRAEGDPGTRVLFVSPEEEYSVVVGSDGVAVWQTTAGTEPGPFPIDVVRPRTEERGSFPFTVLGARGAPTVTPEAARLAAIAAAEEGGVWFGPFFLEKGTILEAAGATSLFDRQLPLVLPGDVWLFWIDDLSGYRYEHPTRMILVDASSDAATPPDGRVLHSTWWPVVRLPRDGRSVSLLGPAAERLTPAVPGPRGGAGSPDACAVLAFGASLPGGPQDLADAASVLAAMNQATDSTVHVISRPASRQDLADAFAAASASGCRTLHLGLSGHGSAVNGGSWLAADGPLPYESLVEMLRAFPELDLRLRIAAPGGDEALAWTSGRGWTGSAVIDSGGVGVFAASPFWGAFSRRPELAIVTDGDRRWNAPPVDIFAEGGVQRIEIRRPEAVGLDRDFVVNVAVDDLDIAAGGPKVFFLPSDQDAIRYGFGGRRQGLTSYEIIANDNTGQVYRATPPHSSRLPRSLPRLRRPQPRR